MNQYDHIRKNLKAYTVPVDKDKLWANTAHAIPKKRNRRGAFFLLLAGTLLVGSGITIYALSGTESNTQENTTLVSQLPVSSTAEVKANNTVNNPVASNESSTSQPVSMDITNAKSNKQKSSTSSGHPSARKAKSIKAENPLSSTTSKPAARSKNTSGFITSKSDGDTNPSKYMTDSDLMYDHSSANNTTDVSIQTGAADADLRNGQYATEEISALPITMLPYTPEDYSPGQPAAIKAKNKSNFNIVLLQGYGWSTLDMASATSELQPVVDEWKGSIKSLENLSTSLQATIRLPKGIQLGGGLQYSRLATQMKYVQSSTEDLTEQGTTTTIIGEDGSFQNLQGDVHVNRQTISDVTRYTYHNRLDAEALLGIPVYRSYRFETDVWVKAGYNLLYQSKGTTFSPDEPVKFSATDNPYTLESPFTFGAGVGALYRINTHWTLHARLGYDRLRYTHGLYDDLISFHHHILSLSLGAGYVIK